MQKSLVAQRGDVNPRREYKWGSLIEETVLNHGVCGKGLFGPIVTTTNTIFAIATIATIDWEQRATVS